MRKIQLETIEKISKERRLNKETKDKINKQVFWNLILSITILIFFIVLKYISINIEKNLCLIIYKTLSTILLIITIVLFEIAYKKDGSTLITITSIETLFLAITTLIAPYFLIERNNMWNSMIGIYFTVYYIIKCFIIYKNEKNKYLKEKNDIIQIVKKESQDELAKEQLERNKPKIEEKPKRKRGRPKKNQK